MTEPLSAAEAIRLRDEMLELFSDLRSGDALRVMAAVTMLEHRLSHGYVHLVDSYLAMMRAEDWMHEAKTRAE